MSLIDEEELITEKAKIRFRQIRKFIPSVESEFIEGGKL